MVIDNLDTAEHLCYFESGTLTSTSGDQRSTNNRQLTTYNWPVPIGRCALLPLRRWLLVIACPLSVANCHLPLATCHLSLVPCLSPACVPISRTAHNYRAIDKHGCKFFPVLLTPSPKAQYYRDVDKHACRIFPFLLTPTPFPAGPRSPSSKIPERSGGEKGVARRHGHFSNSIQGGSHPVATREGG